MSQSELSDTDPSVDVSSPPTQHPDTDTSSSQDAPAAVPTPSAPLQPPIIPESSGLPQEMTAGDSATGETAEVPAEPLEASTERQPIECDQPVSLEAEAAEEDVEVCSTRSSSCT